MFIVTNSTCDGCLPPSVFVHKEDAMIFKRNLALNKARLSVFGIDYAETLDKSTNDAFTALFRRINENLCSNNFNEQERGIIHGFEEFLKNKDCYFFETGDYINYPNDSHDSIELFEISAPSDIETSAGKATAVSYDDGCAKGIHILLDDQIVCALDVYEDEPDGEARVLAYKKEYGEDEEEAPISCTIINR